MNPRGGASENDVRQVLANDACEPRAELDRRIYLAARDFPTAQSAARYARPRLQRRLAGFAIAASVVLAVVMTTAPPAPVDDPVVEPAPDRVETPIANPSSTPGPVLRSVVGLETLRERLRVDAARAEFPGAACVDPGMPVLAGHFAVCVYSHYLEVYSRLDTGCPEPQRLYHDDGKVTMTTSDGEVDILVNGEVLWRVGCIGATWRVEAP